MFGLVTQRRPSLGVPRIAAVKAIDTFLEGSSALGLLVTVWLRPRWYPNGLNNESDVDFHKLPAKSIMLELWKDATITHALWNRIREE